MAVGEVFVKDNFSFEYVPNAADANAGFSLGFFGTPARTTRTLLLFLGIPAFAIYQLMKLTMRGGSWLDYALMALIFAGFFWFLPFYFLMRAFLVRTVLKRQLANGPTQIIDIDKECIERKTRGRISKISWSEISSFREFDLVFAFYKEKRAVAAIEKSVIPSLTELDEFREFLREAIGLKPSVK